MDDLIRCPTCRGAKKLPKLGGIIGTCDLCVGTGKIAACDKPKPFQAEVIIATDEIVSQVADCVPVKDSLASVNEQLDKVGEVTATHVATGKTTQIFKRKK